jgi:hypothetical protein
MVSTFFIWFSAPFLASLVVARFRRPAQPPPALWQLGAVGAIMAVVSVMAVTLDGSWDVPIAAGAAGIGIFAGQWLGTLARGRKPSPD